MLDLERIEKALYYLKKEKEIIIKMQNAKIENKDIRKLRKKFKDLKSESMEYEVEKKAIILKLLDSNDELNLIDIDKEFLKSI